MHQLSSYKSQLMQYFAAFPKEEILYMTEMGTIFTHKDFEYFIEVFDRDSIMAVTKTDLAVLMSSEKLILRQA